jgi:ABC-type lipoprotein release transport system permease subunit
VVGDFRRDATRMPDAEDPLFSYHLRSPTPASPSVAADSQSFIDSGGSYGVLTVSVRVANPAVLPAVQAAVQRMDPRLAVSMSLVDERYAQLNSHILLAARAVGVFSLVSFAIAMAGLYGVIAFVVAGRRREIGIRMALGAAAADIRRMVLTTSARMVVAGAAAGVAIAFWAAHWVESQLFGVSPSDPTTYGAVVAAVALTGLVATWAPARQAAAIDPAITLRAE